MHVNLPQRLAKRPLLESLYRDLAQRSLAEFVPRGLWHRACQDISDRALKQRSYLEICYRDLVWRFLTETLSRDLEKSLTEILVGDGKGSCPGGLAHDLHKGNLKNLPWYIPGIYSSCALQRLLLEGGSRPTENFHGFSLSNFRNLETPFFGDFRNVFIQNASADPADILVRPEVREMSPGKSKAEFTWRCLEIYAPGDALIECTNNWSTRLFGVPRRGPCNIYYRIRDRNLMEYI